MPTMEGCFGNPIRFLAHRAQQEKIGLVRNYGARRERESGRHRRLIRGARLSMSVPATPIPFQELVPQMRFSLLTWTRAGSAGSGNLRREICSTAVVRKGAI